MPTYATKTDVPSDRSRNEIEQTLRRYGASQFGYMSSGDKAAIGFECNGRRIRYELALPPQSDFDRTPGRGYVRKPHEREAHWEQACRQRWRALALLVKAQLEAVEAGIITFEQAFLAHTMLPTGKSVSETVMTGIADAYAGKNPPLLLGKL
jgi:hypothetical protein